MHLLDNVIPTKLCMAILQNSEGQCCECVALLICSRLRLIELTKGHT